MFIYQPHINSTDRVVWHGGESTQLHYQFLDHFNDGRTGWIDSFVRTLGNGIPSGMSEMHAELVDFYNYCQLGDIQ
jgi:hypothetical protein